MLAALRLPSGLKFDAVQVSDLQGQRTAWKNPTDAAYPHPEVGVTYIFGYETIYDSILSFGKIEEGNISISWSGLCDVLWSGDFGSAVPFSLGCRVEI